MPGDKQPFPPGVSGNPSGRPKKTPEMREAEQLARSLTPRAIRRLSEIMEGEDDHAAIKAANSILDRAFGKPAQAITAEVTTGPNQEAVDALEALRREIAAMASRRKPEPIEAQVVQALPAAGEES